ncbi:hypothetical protein COV93_08675 [Candidatus Woesearchaeota archaeon CG11_big_fil_rev_8_21_14_0_20_43_8]|nr:MAG: hypothetical protein COV93_08675 [Candidatus Woesearchaeota archaeon CG11_big_fil_rev_8_21_14_0_20_43_8]
MEQEYSIINSYETQVNTEADGTSYLLDIVTQEGAKEVRCDDSLERRIVDKKLEIKILLAGVSDKTPLLSKLVGYARSELWQSERNTMREPKGYSELVHNDLVRSVISLPDPYLKNVKKAISESHLKAVKSELNRATSIMVDRLSWGFKYSGSVSTKYGHGAEIDTYFKAGIKNLNTIEELIANGIVPHVEAGSRSQGSAAYSTVFSFDAYVNAGITKPTLMLRLAKEGITPHDIEKTKEMQKTGINLAEMTNTQIVRTVKQVLGGKFKPSKFDLW